MKRMANLQNWRIISVFFLGLWCAAASAWGEPIIVQVTGVVNSIDFPTDSIQVGSSMVGFCSYDTETPDEDPSDNRGTYALNQLAMAIGDYIFTRNSASSETALFDVWKTDMTYRAQCFYGIATESGLPLSFYNVHIKLIDLCNASVGGPDDLLTVTFPDISFFTWRNKFEVTFSQSGTGYQIQGVLTSIEVVSEPPLPRVIYVDDDAPPGGDGLSWPTAYKYLQDALDDAGAGDEIRVAAGTYYPSVEVGGTGDRYRTFQLINGVAIYGGFPTGGSTFANRDPNQYETILSGDIGTSGDNTDNCYHVFYHPDGLDLDPNAILDGFTITAGNADSYPHNDGGGMYNSRSSPTVANCTFSNNSAYEGGGIYNEDNSDQLVTNCTFTSNSAYGNFGYGGGMNNTNSKPVLVNCIFTGNSAGGGGGMWNSWNSRPRVTGCIFVGNSANRGSGMGNWESRSIVIGCSFTDNSADHGGGGMCNESSSNPSVTNCTFTGNSANRGGGGMHNSANSSPTVTGCIFTKNSSFSSNTYGGGGMYNDYFCVPTLTNCTFIGNLANRGGGMYNNCNSDPNVTNCTFNGNSADEYGGGVYNRTESSPTVNNCIFWGNTASNGNEIALTFSSTINIAYCDVQGDQADIYDDLSGNTINWGSGNIDADPFFIDADGDDDTPGTEDDNLRLQASSPCIDTGDNSIVTTATDLDGNPRIVNGTVDMGSYEHQLPRVIYVDTDAVGANDGSSWEDAFSTYIGLQTALAVASSGDQIRVAQGVYKPDITNGIVPPSRSATFQLKNGVTIEGGYAGFGEPDANAHDIKLYETILSGDLDGDDEDFNPNGTNNDENSYHVVTGTNTNETAILDGFTITAGNADGPGFWEASCGGGMYNYEDASPTLTNCTFRGNRARTSGGGMYNRSTSNLTHPTLTNCTFNGNVAEASGGAIMFRTGNTEFTTVLTNCIFSGNSADWIGGAIDNIDSDLTLTNCTFVGNWVEWDDGTCGALRITENSRQTITNCIFWANLPNQIGGDDDGWIRVTHSDIQDGWQEWYDEDKGNIDVDPLFVDADGLDNIAGTEDDNLRLLPWSPCIDAGDNSVVDANIPDLDSNSRIINGIVDMGAYEALLPIEADVHIVPRTINRRSRMKRVMAIIRLPEPVGRHDVADEPFELYADGFDDEPINATWQRVIGWGRRTKVFALFDKDELMEVVPGIGRVELAVVGKLETGQYMYGSDTVRIVQPRRRRPRWGHGRRGR